MRLRTLRRESGGQRDEEEGSEPRLQAAGGSPEGAHRFSPAPGFVRGGGGGEGTGVRARGELAPANVMAEVFSSLFMFIMLVLFVLLSKVRRQDNRDLILALTATISARPRTFDWTNPITLPMSRILVAPDSCRACSMIFAMA